MALLKDRALERLSDARKAGRLAHAYLLAGPPGCGKAWLAMELAGMILGFNPSETTSHADLYQVAPESKSRRIVTDQIRSLEHALQMKPLLGIHKVAILHDADRMQPQAANAFLKTLEEPPEGCHILLTTTLRDAVLTTILSRCITVPLLSPTGSLQDAKNDEVAEAFVAALLQKGGPDAGAALRFTKFFQGQVSALREHVTGELEGELKDQIKHYRDSMDKSWKDTREDQIKAQSEAMVVRERQRLLTTISEVLAAALRYHVLPNLNCPPHIQSLAASNDTKLLLKRLDALDRTRRLLSAGVQESLALESGFLQMIAPL
ncbi:MAG: AAA family ATPase [Verrucomicrobia bacterium]|nr:AAA family ATPase [Verrucomicrobiota bacterium]